MNTIRLKLILTGGGPGGRSTYIKKLLTGKFSDDVRMTIGVDFFSKKLMLDNIELKIQLWDFAGEDRFTLLLPTYCKEASGAIIMFDLTYPKDYSRLKKWLNLFRDNAVKDAPFIVVGNKLDLIDSNYGVIERKEIQLYAQELNSQYFEISVKTGYNVKSTFNTIINLMLEQIPNEIIQEKLPYDFLGQFIEDRKEKQFDITTIEELIVAIKSFLKEGIVTEAKRLRSIINKSIQKVSSTNVDNVVKELEEIFTRNDEKTRKTLITNKNKIHSLMIQEETNMRCPLHEELDAKCMKIDKIRKTINKPKIHGFLMYEFPKKQNENYKNYKEEVDKIIELINFVNENPLFKIKTPEQATSMDVKTCDFCRIARSYDFGILLLSPPNPNAFLEAGMFLSLGKKVILLNNELSLKNAPFDLTPYFYLNYKNTSELEENWNKKIIPFLQNIEKTYLA